jgi:SPP1 gp7 family putative phage head morphogenesis protein
MSRDIIAAGANSQGGVVSGATYIRNPSSPFAQTGMSVAGYVPLPRPVEDFNSGFGPGVPLFPDALDALGPGGRVMPRRAQYLVAANLQLLDRAIPWTALKWIATECDVVNRCLLPGTEVLTRRGLLPIENVVVGDLVLTHRGRWRSVTEVMANPAYQQCYEVTSTGLAPLRATGNHPVYVAEYKPTRTNAQVFQSFAWKTVEDLQSKKRGKFDGLCLPVLDLSDDDPTLDIASLNIPRGRNSSWVDACPSAVTMDYDFGHMVGWYMAEGCAASRSPIGPTGIVFTLSETETSIAYRLLCDIERIFGFSGRIRPNRNTHSIQAVVCGATLARMLSCGTARTKSLPDWVWQGGRSFMTGLLDGWSNGDGSLIDHGPNHAARWTVWSASCTLAWQMRLIAIALGHNATVYSGGGSRTTIIRGQEVTSGDSHWVASWSDDPRKTGQMNIEDDEQLVAPVRSVKPIDYDGLVYNLEVDEDHSFVTTAGVTHNCIQLVQDGLCGREWSWGFSDSIIQQIMTEDGESNHARAMDLAQTKYGTELDRVKEFFERPDPRGNHSFSQWLSEMVWQSLVYDGVVIYPQYTLGGDLYALSPIDTSTIKILLDNQGFPPNPPAPAYQQILYGFPRGEFQAADGAVDGEYQSDQLAYYIRRPRPESVYGYPPTEEVMTVATTYLQRQAWMRAEYTYGVTPRTYYKMDKDNPTGWTPEQQFGYEQAMNDRLSGQIQRRQQAFLLPPGLEPMWPPQLEQHYKSDYDNFLIIQMAAKFGVPASQVGVQAKAGLSGGKQMEGEEDQTEHFVFTSMINFYIDILNDLARRYLGIGREITATCQDPGGSEQDIVQQANADTQTVNNGRLTLNDWRAKNGLPLYAMPEADEPFIAGAQGPVFLKGTLAVQDANTESTLNPPEPPKQVFVGPDGKPLPTAPDGSPVPPAANNGGTDGTTPAAASNADTGRESSDSGTGKTSTDSDGGTELTGSSPSKGNSASDAKSESDTDAEKELRAFVKFAKARVAKGAWRDFAFSAVPPVRAGHLNALGRAGDLEAIKAVVSAQPDAAGIVCRASDSGRVLMVQRVGDDKLAPGTWEWPGGGLHKGEDAFTGAQREWEDEVGVDLPKGDVVGSWLTPDGTYQAFVYTIDHESDIDLTDVDRDESEIAAAAWWEPSDIVGNSAVRVEVQSADWAMLGAAKAVKAGPKAPAQATGQTTRNWASQPHHKYADAIIAFYAPKLAAALKDSITGVDQAIASAKRKYLAAKVSTQKAAGDITPAKAAATAAVTQDVKVNSTAIQRILEQMAGDATVAGAHSAAMQIGTGATLGSDLEGLTAGLDWSSWQPGWAEAADLAKLGNWQDMLGDLNITIQGMSDNSMDRIATALADGLEVGSPVDTIADNIADVVGSDDRAEMIANTECSRIMADASIDTYADNDIAEWEWLAEDDDRTCDDCDDLDGQSFDVSPDSDDDQQRPPMHPRCRCVPIPSTATPGVDTSREALAPTGDWV